MRFFQNCRKPTGFGGRMMAKGMNTGHRGISDFGFAFAPEGGVSDAADFGCGGGANVARLLSRYPGAKVTGLDYSEVSVDVSAKLNRAAIDAGRCRIVQGDVSAAPFEDGSFDLVVACETVYFWPIEKGFAEVHRTLRPGGTFLLMVEFDGKGDRGKRWEKRIDGMRVYTAGELTALLERAGFSDIEPHSKNPKLAISARRPVSP